MRTEWSFLTGLGIGAVAGLILAPQSGKDTQELLAEKLQGGLDQIASAGKQVGTQVKDFANRKKENVTEAIDADKDAKCKAIDLPRDSAKSHSKLGQIADPEQ